MGQKKKGILDPICRRIGIFGPTTKGEAIRVQRRWKFYPGWGVVIGLFFSTFFGSWGRYIVPALMGFMIRDLGWSATGVNLSVSIALWTYAAGSTLAGRLVDRLGGRLVIAIGGLFLVVGFFLLSLVHTLWQLYLYHGVILAMGTSFTHLVPTQAVARKWFIKLSGFIGGLLAIGFAISQALLAPLLTYGAGQSGWRFVSFTATSFGFAVLVLALVLVKDTPESVGLLPYGVDGNWSLAEKDGLSRKEPVILNNVLKNSSFWAACIGYGLLGIPIQGFLANAVNWGTAVALPAGSAGVALTLFNVTATPAKIIWGLLADKLGKRKVLLLSQVICAVVMLGGWLLVHGPTSFYVFVMSFGLAYGAAFVLMAPYFGDLFGRRLVATLYGFASAAHGLLGGVGPLLWGVISDRTGQYNQAALVSALAYVASVGCFAIVREAVFDDEEATNSQSAKSH